jgi:hypothetical protein
MHDGGRLSARQKLQLGPPGIAELEHPLPYRSSPHFCKDEVVIVMTPFSG